MSFNPLNFILTRASNGQLPTISSPAVHMYGTAVDNIATCLSSGYFDLLLQHPITANYSGGINDNMVLVGDVINCHATDGTTLLVISSINSTTITTSRLIPNTAVTTGTYTTTLVGPWTIQPSITATYTMVADMVMIHFPSLSHSADGFASTMIANTALPLAITPTDSGGYQVMRIINNGSAAYGMININPAGIPVIYADVNFGNFITGSTAGYSEFTLSYKLA